MEGRIRDLAMILNPHNQAAVSNSIANNINLWEYLFIKNFHKGGP